MMLRVSLACIAVLFPTALRAQDPIPTARSDSAMLAALRALSPQTVVRLRTGRGFPIDGELERVESDTVVMRTQGAQLRKVPATSVTEVFTRYRQVGRGAIIGGVAGGVVIGLLGIAAVAGFCEQPDGCKNDYPTAFFFGGAIGGSAGALIGAGIGALTFGWRRIFP
jgi:hypothetical protein